MPECLARLTSTLPVLTCVRICMQCGDSQPQQQHVHGGGRREFPAGRTRGKRQKSWSQPLPFSFSLIHERVMQREFVISSRETREQCFASRCNLSSPRLHRCVLSIARVPFPPHVTAPARPMIDRPSTRKRLKSPCDVTSTSL